MRLTLIAAAAATLLAMPLAAQASTTAPVTDFSAQSIHVGPGGVRVGDGHRRYESRSRRMDRRRCVTERTTRTTPSGRVIRESRQVCR